MRKAIEVITAAVRRIVAVIVNAALRPIAKLAKYAAKANRKMMRWAVRNDCGPLYLFAIFWGPTLSLAALIWASVAALHAPKTAGALMVVLVVANKALSVLLYALNQIERVSKAARHYRRHF